VRDTGTTRDAPVPPTDSGRGEGGAGGDAGRDTGADAAREGGPVTGVDAGHDAGVDARSLPCDLAAPFGAPTPVNELNIAAMNSGAILSPDQLTVYFGSIVADAGPHLLYYTASRGAVSAPFANLSSVPSLDLAASDTWNVTITGNGRTAFLVTDFGGAGNQMMSATRASTSAPFGGPVAMPGSLVGGAQPCVLPDGSALYYTDQSATPYRIGRASLSGTTVLGTTDLPITVTGPDGGLLDVGLPVVNQAETVMYFDAFNVADHNTYDIWVTSLNTPSLDSVTWLSPDECVVYIGRADATATHWTIWSAQRP